MTILLLKVGSQLSVASYTAARLLGWFTIKAKLKLDHWGQKGTSTIFKEVFVIKAGSQRADLVIS